MQHADAGDYGEPAPAPAATATDAIVPVVDHAEVLAVRSVTVPVLEHRGFREGIGGLRAIQAAAGRAAFPSG
jgi:hypothetical protein